MSLRKSPKRTPALLAANRRNARKSTGPRTPIGKWHSAGNAVRHYRRTPPSSCIPIENLEIKAFEDFYFALREAIMPADSAAGTEAVLLNAARVWRVKRSFDRWIATQTEEDWLVLATGAVRPPSFWRLRLRRPGLSVPDWTVTISVWLRWGRGLGQASGQGWGQSRPSAAADDEKPDRPRMHTMVSVHSTGPCRPAEEVESERTKPECDRAEEACENMSGSGDPETASGVADERETRADSSLRGKNRRTKPEYRSKQEPYKNMSGIGEWARRNPRGRDRMTILGKLWGIMKAVFHGAKTVAGKRGERE
jgi:hypothetical protein